MDDISVERFADPPPSSRICKQLIETSSPTPLFDSFTGVISSTGSMSSSTNKNELGNLSTVMWHRLSLVSCLSHRGFELSKNSRFSLNT